MRFGAVVACACFAAPLQASAATEPPARVELRWTRGDGAGQCISEDEARVQIAAHLGRDPFAPPAPVRRPGARLVEAEIVGGPRGLRATVTMVDEHGDASGRREIDSEDVDCVALGRATVLMAALAAEQSEATAPSQAPPPSIPPPSVERDAPTGPEPARRVAIEAGLGAAIGLAPAPGPAYEAGASLRIADSVRGSLRGVFVAEQRTPERTFSSGMAAAGPGVCYEASSARVSAAACAHVLAGSQWVVDTSVPVQDAGAHLWLGGAPSVEGRVHITPNVHIFAELSAVFPFTRSTYVTQACPPTGFQQAPAAGLGVFGGGASF